MKQKYKLISAIFATIYAAGSAILLIPLIWMIPMTIKYWKAYLDDKKISPLFSIMSCFFFSPVAGIIYLVYDVIHAENNDKRFGLLAYIFAVVSTISSAELIIPLFYTVAFAKTIKEANENDKRLSTPVKILTMIFCSILAGVFLFVKKDNNKEIQRFGKYQEEDKIELLRLSKLEAWFHNFVMFFANFPHKFIEFWKKFGRGFIQGVFATGRFFRDLWFTFIKGSWKTKVSYFIMGFGSFARGQWLRGLLFLGFQIVFILYMIFFGGYHLSMLGSLGLTFSHTEGGVEIPGDNSFNILLYGVLSLFFIAALLVTWYFNVKQNRINDQIEKDKKKLDTAKDDLRAMVDKNFHVTLLALPTVGITIFTVLPIFFMILVAFTTYDGEHMPPSNLFGWAGFRNFAQLFQWTNSGGASFSMTFGQILLWTLVWAFFATFTNYFIGMLIAMLINKKGIKLKKVWRTILVFSIAIPQFISLLFVSKMFTADGIVNNIWLNIATNVFHIADAQPIPFWENEWLARITVILINVWIGVPYLMLVVTGILMNIPADLYESANIDGANPWQQYTKITLPYMLFVTGPYLLTSFTGNMNNFNVIYLLTGGGPTDQGLYKAGHTDLLITWLFSLTNSNKAYNLAAVIGIMVFIVVAVVSLVVYNLIPSTRNEEEFQ